MIRLLDNESVLLNLETQRYFSLDQIGTRMWRRITFAPTIDAVYQRLMDEYDDVSPELLCENLAELLRRLVEQGTPQVVPADVGMPSPM